jgi:arylsulfatase A-like enzyme
VENIDVAPTIAEVLGIDPPEDAQRRKVDTRDNGNRGFFFR